MTEAIIRSCTAFAGEAQLASGDLLAVVGSCKTALDSGLTTTLLIFNDVTAEPIEIDFRGTIDDVTGRITARARNESIAVQRGPGRPKLGVVAREVTLLPRHWEWLATQPGGASVSLRRLVENARRGEGGAERIRLAQEAAYRFMSAMAGNQPGFEEATRALFAGNAAHFHAITEGWPRDVADYANMLAAGAF